jgi:hypothetical protein
MMAIAREFNALADEYIQKYLKGLKKTGIRQSRRNHRVAEQRQANRIHQTLD